MHDLIDGTVDWNEENLFGAICDWHVPGLLFTYLFVYLARDHLDGALAHFF